MNREQVGQAASMLIAGVLAFFAAKIEILECFPLIPAVYCWGRMDRKRNYFMYAGFLMGIMSGMSLGQGMKYLSILIIGAVGLGLYETVHKGWNPWTASGICAGITFVMSISGGLLGKLEARQWLLAFCETLMAYGGAVLLYYGLGYVREVLFKERETSKEYQYAVAGISQGQMEAFSKAFQGLATTIGEMPKLEEPQQDLEDPEQVKRCVTCEDHALCWNLMNRQWDAKMRENRLVLKEQLEAVVNLLNMWQGQSKCMDRDYERKRNQILFHCRERGILIREIHFYREQSGHEMIRAVLSGIGAGGIPVKRYLEVLEKVFGDAFVLEQESRCIIGKEQQVLTAYREGRFYTLSGVATRKKDGVDIGGDSFLQQNLEQGIHMMMISDGMGSGEKARKESRELTELMEAFVRAGFSPESALHLLNSSMMLQGANEAFSTLDLGILNLYEGTLRLFKSGAVASYLVRDGQAIILREEELPTGVHQEGLATSIEMPLNHGDFLVMVSDGVVEYLHTKDPEGKLGEMMEEIHTKNPGVFAKKLLEQVLFHTEGYAMDDMTILVTGIWEKG